MENNFSIITDRLIMRPIRLGDSDLIFKYRSDEVVNQYQGWIPKTIKNTQDFIRQKVSFIIDLPGTWFQLVILDKHSNELIGDIGIHFSGSDNFQVEIGCTLDKAFHGKGFATEALKAVIDFLFYKLNKRRIIASIDPRNHKSIRLIERIGFRKEAHFKESILINNAWVDDLVYAILKSEWNNNPFTSNAKNNKLIKH